MGHSVCVNLNRTESCPLSGAVRCALWCGVSHVQGKTPAELRELYRSAHNAGLQALQEEVAAAAAGVSESDWGQLLETLEPIQVASGSRVSGPLIAALEVLQQGDMSAVGGAVASLSWQQLQALPTSLLWDLAWLVQDGWKQQDEAQVQLFGGLLRHYVQVS